MTEQPTTVDVETGEIVPVSNSVLSELRGLYDPELDFRKLALEATYHARGFRLVNKSQLIGVPHVIVNCTFREGYMKDNVQGDYVSLEAVIADQDTLDAPQVRYMLPHDLTVYQNEPVIYNDGGTGVRRSMVELFSMMGIIDVGGKPDDPMRYDRPLSMWKRGAEEALTGITTDNGGHPFRYLALRGLRRSDYDSPYGPATTFYFG